ncbi:uncharacterized protein ACB058_004818 isoform 2-T2 [Synchiropus picturatus]
MLVLRLTCLLILTGLRISTVLGQSSGCLPDQWQCDDGNCIPDVWRCDGGGDCLDGSDEMDCDASSGSPLCPSGHFPCLDTVGCVAASARCDGQKNCPTGSDEENCPVTKDCLDTDWTCGNRVCVLKELRCNGQDDCMDNSDEANCVSCEANGVQCPDGSCLPAHERCDKTVQCSDGSDEPVTCGRTCAVKNGGCSHVCVDEPWGARCACPDGFKLSSNGAICIDIDECSLPFPPCMQLCANTLGSFYCHCREGFQLQGNSTCQVTGNSTRLLTVQKRTIGLLDVKTRQLKSIGVLQFDPVALTFDIARGLYYWADEQGTLYKSNGQQTSIIYKGQWRISSLACDWLTGNLFWTNQKQESIYVLGADGLSYTTVLSKNVSPKELVVLPVASTMSWINTGPGDRVTIEKSWLDGSSRETLAVLTGQSAHSLVADVAARRLYWISDIKQSVETVRLDGSGRYSFMGLFSGNPPMGLAVFGNMFYWVDDQGMWQAPQNLPGQKKFLWKSTQAVFTVFHELQQPQGTSACAMTCDICLLTQGNPAGFTCTCPSTQVLLPDGVCQFPRFVYATISNIKLLEFRGSEVIDQQLFDTDDGILCFDVDWYREWIYWANQTGHVQRVGTTQQVTEIIPLPLPVCIVALDQRTGDLFWVSCDQKVIGTTNAKNGLSRQLYRTEKEIRNLYLDWLRGGILWLEDEQVMGMNIIGGEAKELLQLLAQTNIAFDLSANSLLWNSKNAGLTTLSLLNEKKHVAGRRWNISDSVMCAFEPFLLTLAGDTMNLWDRRDGNLVVRAPVKDEVLNVIPVLRDISVPKASVCKEPSMLCKGTSICLERDRLCDGRLDCPAGDDEFCRTACPSKDDFQCMDGRSCVSKMLVCDGRSHCRDGSDEVNCPPAVPTGIRANALKCRTGLKPCNDGLQCVLYTHVCDGENDCKDGSDELGCDATQAPTTVNVIPIPTTTLTTLPACLSPSVLCPTSLHLCISPNKFCDGIKDCPNGFDEENCLKRCPSKNDFRCKDRRSCVPKSLVCDGRSHCHDGSDEVDCRLTIPPPPQRSSLKCRMGTKHCRDGSECILNSHVCDGEKDCKDGSDEEECEAVEPSTSKMTADLDLIPITNELNPITPCTSPAVLCPGTQLCIAPTQLCDGVRNCPDGSDENCVRGCAEKSDFLCEDRLRCVSRDLVCDGRSHCQDGSDEVNCQSLTTPAPRSNVFRCYVGSRLCQDGTRCVLLSHVCDGEEDCPDGSDETHCGDTASITAEQPTSKPSTTVTTTTAPPCTSPSVLCPGSSVCIKPTQMCDGVKDCIDGSDEKCVRRCPNRDDFRCKDRRSCISRDQVCDGRSHCNDGSDEVGCQGLPTPGPRTNALKCRLGSWLCQDGSECILHSHICDGERDCQDGSDEGTCDSAYTTNPTLSPTEPVTQPPCTSPSVLCPGSSLCLHPAQICDGTRDCPDGYDENCVTKCPNKRDFHCKDRRSCISASLVCDGRAHCLDGSDEVDCPPVYSAGSRASTVKCRLGSVPCRDGSVCVLQSHVCDGERDCKDGSDEAKCDVAEKALDTVTDDTTSYVKPFNPPVTKLLCTGSSILCLDSSLCILPSQQCDGKMDCSDGSDEKGCPDITRPGSQEPVLTCRLGTRLCGDGSECVLNSHVCDGEKDCPDGSDEQGCQESCKKGEFQCAHGKMCIPEAQVCDGRTHCRDGSDELHCINPSKSCEHQCADKKRCIPKKFLCDGEKDCLDGSDELGCDGVTVAPTPALATDPAVCVSPSVFCPGTSVCISQKQICDGNRDCPDAFDERNCVDSCKNADEFLCSDRRKCISRKFVCDGRAQCFDGSDENRCEEVEPTTPFPSVGSTNSAPVKCRKGFKPCSDGLECVMYSHVCDGEKDCQDGSDEDGCVSACKSGEFQCAHGNRCIPEQQVCNGENDCQDRSDEMNCQRLIDGCHQLCDNGTRCIPKSFLCDGERDCADGSDEKKCGLIACAFDQYRCMSGQCVSEGLKCDGYSDCSDHSDEMHCARPPNCLSQLLCPNGHECLQREWRCDGEEDCDDGSDEKNCIITPVRCRDYQWQCGDSNQCIPRSWHCDGKRDCVNFVDEENCSLEKCPAHLYQCDSGECLDPGLACNGITNCADMSDEGSGCNVHNCSSYFAPLCDQHCVSTPNGPKCFCKEGYKLFSTRYCVDMDECEELPHAVCKHICINTPGSYTCHCHPGFYLEPDNKSCKAEDEALLLASVQSELLLLGVHSRTLRLFSSATRPVFSLDYHWSQQRVYWLSPDYQSVRWADMNSSKKGTLIQGVKADFIAVDWIGKNLYWIDGLVGQILAVQLRDVTVGSHNYTVVLGEDLEHPSSLVLLPHMGLIFWSEIGSRPQIRRSGMDGSSKRVIVNHGLSWPVSLASDLLDNRLYWADEKMHSIGSASFEGENVKILQMVETPSPFSVAVFNDRLTWSDTKRRTIRSSDKNTGKDQKVLLKRPGQPFGIKLMHPLSQPLIVNPCDKLRCSHLCLLVPARGLSGIPKSAAASEVTEVTAACRCPKGLLLSKNNRTCSLPQESTFILLLSPNAIYQIYLQSMHRDGVGLKKIPNCNVLSIPGVVEASFMDLSQGQRLYIADDFHGAVEAFNLTGPWSRQRLTPTGRIFELHDDSVTAIAVDWVTANLYWSSSNHPGIHVTSSSDGSTAPLLQGSLKATTAIAVHPPTGRLCYSSTVSLGGKIQAEICCAGMDGRGKVVLWRNSLPTSLSFFNRGTMIYWSDHSHSTICSIGVDGSGYKEFSTSPGLVISFTYVENILIWLTQDKGVTKLWFSDGQQPKQLWFETKNTLQVLKSHSRDSQIGTNMCSKNNGGCAQLCLAYPGGRTCRCGRGFFSVNVTSCFPMPACAVGKQPCVDGSKCIGSGLFCDGRVDCPDQSDEQDCPNEKVSTSVTKLSKGGHPRTWQQGSASCGEFCQDTEGGRGYTAAILAVIFVVGAVLGATYVIVKRKIWESFWTRAPDKENLMTNMGLPCEQHDMDFEELESQVDQKNVRIS